MRYIHIIPKWRKVRDDQTMHYAYRVIVWEEICVLWLLVWMWLIIKKYFEVPGLGCSQFSCDVVWLSAWLSYHRWNYGIFIGWCSYSLWVTHIHKCFRWYTSCLIELLLLLLLLQSLKCISIWIMLTRTMCCSFPNISTILTEIWRCTHKTTPFVLFFILWLKLMLMIG